MSSPFAQLASPSPRRIESRLEKYASCANLPLPFSSLVFLMSILSLYLSSPMLTWSTYRRSTRSSAIWILCQLGRWTITYFSSPHTRYFLLLRRVTFQQLLAYLFHIFLRPVALLPWGWSIIINQGILSPIRTKYNPMCPSSSSVHHHCPLSHHINILPPTHRVPRLFAQ